MSYIKDTFTRFKDFIINSSTTIKSITRDLSFQNIKNLIVREYYNLKEKFSDLKGTNWRLAQYHFLAGNYNDAIMRFKLLQRNNYRLMDANYFLGRIYIEKGNFVKAKEYLDMYLSTQNGEYINEAKYCLAIINNTEIDTIPESIIKNKRDRVALNLDKTDIDNGLLARYGAIVNAIRSEAIQGTRIFEAGCYIGILGRILCETFDQNLQYLKGSEVGEEALQVASQMYVDSRSAYDEIKLCQTTSDLVSDDGCYSIILIPDILSYYCDLLNILVHAFASLENEGIVVFSLRTIKDDLSEKKFEFIHPIEEFRYSKLHVVNIANSCGFQLKENYDIDDNFELFVFKKVTS